MDMPLSPASTFFSTRLLTCFHQKPTFGLRKASNVVFVNACTIKKIIDSGSLKKRQILFLIIYQHLCTWCLKTYGLYFLTNDFKRSLAILSDLHMAGDEKVAEVTVDA